MLGYTWQDTKHNNGQSHLLSAQLGQGEMQNDLFVGAALGVELTPWLGFEAEYNQVKVMLTNHFVTLLMVVHHKLNQALSISKLKSTVTSMLLLI